MNDKRVIVIGKVHKRATLHTPMGLAEYRYREAEYVSDNKVVAWQGKWVSITKGE